MMLFCDIIAQLPGSEKTLPINAVTSLIGAPFVIWLIIGRKKERPLSLCFYDSDWHQGVIGILASRIKDKVNRPVIVFAKDDESEKAIIKGSARSVAGVHIRDVLALIDNRHPNLIEKFGGHAMAAGLSIKEKDFDFFNEALIIATRDFLAGNLISDQIITDGHLSDSELSLNFAHQLKNIGPWGQGFSEPLFDDIFEVVSHRIVGEKHLKLVLEKSSVMLDAIQFFADQNLEIAIKDRIKVVYKLDINEFRGNQTLQLIIEQLEHC